MISRSLAILTGTLILLAGNSVQAQERAEERILKAIDSVLDRELPRVRREILHLVRTELRSLASGPERLSSRAALEKHITETLLKRHATTLASDDYRGRNAGYEGNDRAAAYIAKEFRSLGLKPVGDIGEDGKHSYLQRFSFRSFYTGNRELRTQNVVGLREGSDPHLKNEIVVVGGHFDHVGVGSQGRHLGRLGSSKGDDNIWNGADDNASGTACVLSLARAFTKGNIRTKRSILFILFSAEEAGLYGSKYYCNNPISPISRHVYMLNLDMVGRNPTRPVQIKGVGSAEGPALENAVKTAIRKTGLKAKIEKGSDIFGGDSDHSSFKAKGVPFSFFFSGFHSDYHRVTDHADDLAYGNMAKVARTSGLILESIANADASLRFKGSGRGGNRFDFGGKKDPEEEEKKNTRPRRLLGIYIETVPAADCDALGLKAEQGALRVDRVNEGAGKTAGLRKDDVILGIGGGSLGREDPRGDLRRAIEGVKAGARVDLVVLRGGGKVMLKVGWDR